MPDNDGRSKALTGQVLPPIRSEHHLPIERPLGGIPLFNRIRYREVRKELEEYLAVLRTRNSIVAELNETAELGERYQAKLVRMERLDDIRRIEGLKVDTELDAALDKAIEQNETARISSLERRARAADAEASAIEAEERLARMKSPPPAPEARPKQSEAEWIAGEVRKLRQHETELIAALVGEVGSEDDLSEEDQELVERVRMATRDSIEKLFEK